MASIKKLGTRKYKITVCNGYRPDGRKISRSRTIQVPESVGNRGIQQYVQHEAEELERQFRFGYLEDAETSFEDFAEGWLDRQTKYAAGTLGYYRRALSVIYPIIGKLPLNRIQPIVLENMLMELRERKSHGKRISETTVQKYLTVVSAVLSDAKRNQILSANPARMIDLPDTSAPIQQIPNEEEMQAFLTVLANQPLLYTAYYALAIFTGCRRGELCALKWSDFTLNGYDGVMRVHRSRSHVPGTGVVEGPTKNGKERLIALPDPVMSLVVGLAHHQKRIAEEAGRRLGDYLFVNEDGEPIHPDTFTKHFRRLCDENGLSKAFHLHTLRHYFVSTMLHNGVDKQTVAELAGHGDTSFLERTYCHPQMLLKQQAANTLVAKLLPEQTVEPVSA